jgi:hypothetical protein
MAQNNTQNTGRSIYLDTTAATTAINKLTETAATLTRQIQAGEKAGKNMNTEIAKLSEVQGKIKEVQNVLDKGLAPSLREQEKLVKQLRLELRGMSSDADGFDKKRKAYITATNDLEKLRGKVGAVSQANNQLGGSFLNFTKNVAGIALATIGVQGLFHFLQGSITEAEDAEQSLSRLKNTLSNIGREDALERLVDKSNELAQSFKFLDNDDINKVFQKLITYGKLTERQIGELTDVIINFSKKNKISLEESSTVIIKALEGSGKALKEYGINMKDGGDVTERFGIIMQDLKPKVDGAADAFGETFEGKLAIARQSIKDTQEEIGNGLIPVLAALLKATSEGLKGIGSLFEIVKNTFALGSFEGALAVNNAKQLAAGREAADKKQIENIIKANELDAKGKKRNADQIIKALEQENEGNMQQIALTRLTGDFKSEALYTTAKELTLKAIEKVKKDFNPALDKILGDGDKSKKDDSLQKEYDRMRAEFEQLIKALNQTAHQLDLSPMEQEFLKINDSLEKQIADIQKYEKAGAISAKQAAEAIKLAQLAASVESDIAYEKDQKRRAKARFDTDGLRKDLEELMKERNKLPDDKKLNGGSNVLAALGRDQLAGLQNNVTLATTSKARRISQINLLEEERNRELSNATLTENEKIKINLAYNEKRKQIEQEHSQEIAGIISEALGYASQALNILGSFAQARTNIENEALKRDIANNDKRKRNLEINAKKGLVTEQEVRIQTLKMDQELDDKKRKLEAVQFERNKKQQIAQALINGALGVTQAWVKPGFPLAIALTAIIAAQTAAQIAVISSQKPQFAHGGILPGPSHRDGGLPVINPRTGKAVAEVEGGELILSKKFVQSNPALVPSLLHASRIGQKLSFLDRPYQGINYAAVSRAGTRKYASGGIFDAGGSAGNTLTVAPSTERMENLLDALIKKLDQPSVAVISQQKIDQAAAIKNKIISEAAFM